MFFDQYKLGAIPISPDILNKSNIGLWAFELDEGEAPRMYVDDVMLSLIGLAHQVSPEETYHAWYDNIDNGSYDLVADAVSKMMSGEHAEVQYPWHHPDGRTMVVRCGGVRNFEYTKGARIEGVHQDVSEVIHFDEKAAREYEQLVNSLAGSFSSVILLEKSGSASIIKHSDNRKYDILRRTPYPEAARAFINTYVYEADRAMLEEASDSGHIFERAVVENTYRLHFRITDGRTGLRLWCEAMVRLVSDHSAIIALREHNDVILRDLVNEKLYNEYASIFVVDLKTDYFRFLYRNPESGFKDVSGGVYTDTIKEYTSRVNSEYREDWNKLCSIESVRELLSKENRFEYCYPLEGVKKRWRRCVLRLLDCEDGVPCTFIMTFMTIDDAQSAQLELSAQVAKQKEQLEKQEVQLRDALDSAQTANSAKTVFLNNMSHDMRTPLNAILGFNNIALREIGHDDDKVRDCLEKVSRSGGYLLDIVNDVLEISRIESGKLSLNEENFKVSDSFAEVETVMHELARNLVIDLSFSIGDIQDEYVMCDIKQIGRVFANLISNAIKYTPKGGWVKVCCTQAGRDDDGRGVYRYTFEDNGIGISKEFQERLYDRFAREQTSTVSGIQGTGLGLSMCKEVINFMGGTITCRSDKGKGTLFTVDLPLKLQNETAAVTPEDRPEAPEIDFSGKRLLLVEDNELNREISTVILSEFGFVVDTANDGDVAVEKMASAKAGDYDAVIMDVQMPKMDGYTATRHIRALGTEISRIPIIAMTANAFAEDRQAALDAGMDDHLSKPVDVGKLKEILGRLL